MNAIQANGLAASNSHIVFIRFDFACSLYFFFELDSHDPQCKTRDLLRKWGLLRSGIGALGCWEGTRPHVPRTIAWKRGNAFFVWVGWNSFVLDEKYAYSIGHDLVGCRWPHNWFSRECSALYGGALSFVFDCSAFAHGVGNQRWFCWNQFRPYWSKSFVNFAPN